MRKIGLTTPLEGLYNDLGDVIRLFYGEVELSPDGEGDPVIVHSLDENGHLVVIGDVCAAQPKSPMGSDALENKRLLKRAAKMCLYNALKAYTGKKPPWGSLTGIRPTRLFVEQLERGKSFQQAEDALVSTFDLDRDKAKLLGRIVSVQQGLPAPGDKEMDVDQHPQVGSSRGGDECLLRLHQHEPGT